MIELCCEYLSVQCIWLYAVTVSHTFQHDPTLYICLNVKELLPWNWHDIWSLSDSNGIQTHNHLVRKQTLNLLAKMAKWLNYVVSTYLYGAFDCMLLSCHVCVSESKKYSQMHHTDKYSQHSSIKSVRLWTRWLWVQIPLLWLKLQISRLFRARSFLTFRQIQNVDSLWNTYVTW